MRKSAPFPTALMLTVLVPLVPSIALAADQPAPCATDPKFHDQDFALGTWDVYADGDKVAEATFEPVLKGCAIHETWTGVNGKDGDGLGLFAYSRQLKSWSYLWTADTGWTTTFTGGALSSPGTMTYLTQAPRKEGGMRTRIWSLSLQPDGSVKELARGSDDGKTWTTEYELHWRRKK